MFTFPSASERYVLQVRRATGSDVADRLAALQRDEPRVVVAGNFGAPYELVRVLDATLPRVRAFSLTIQPGWSNQPRRSSTPSS